MKTLDELLSERAQASYQNALADVLDPASWTESNRDAKLLEIRGLAEGVSRLSEEFVKELLELKIDGKSVLWHKIQEQFIMGEIELLMGFRDELDVAETKEQERPFISYDWLNACIKERFKEITTINEKIVKLTAPEGEVEVL